MNSTSQLGLLTEVYCQLDFSALGILLSKPIISDSRYDFIADVNGVLLKIQCKTAHPENNDIISITTSSKNWNNGIRHYYKGQIDYFYTYYNNQGYLLPINIIKDKQRNRNIRLGQKNQYQSNNINAIYGSDYEIEKVLKENFNYCAEKVLVENMKFHKRS